MEDDRPGKTHVLIEHAPEWLVRLGIRSWLLIGVIIVGSLVFSLLTFASGLSVPLIVAAVIAMLFYPFVQKLEQRNVPRSLGAGIVLLLLLAAIGGALWLTVSGVISQSGEIGAQVQKGLVAMEHWFSSSSLPPGLIDEFERNVQKIGPALAGGAASAVASGLSGGVAFIFGTFIGVFMLIYLLIDWESVASWVGSNLGVPAELGEGLVDDATVAVRQYFRGLTYSLVIVSALIGLAVYLLGLPLAFPIAVVTFLTGYIPFFGAIVAGLFAFLVALGSGGLVDAFVVLIVVLVTQNVVQTLVINQLASSELKIHPLVVLLATIFGGIVAGLLGATLGAPLAALVQRGFMRVKSYSMRADAST
ncbi:MAG: AI-2E family transporter [Coriobacteriia bacterium]|jgi:predicted PurR-regulated permease PerM|nr:AI-2E family transporter [Coriobacteriia bacterium]